ncbi:ABC transporter permease [Cryobacterium glaciale]|uniref:Autoinducer 2 import system permease protein LsrC n=1 Tax=Cryobacterium glaciale TaxID=1259145 RepID=A0A4R8V284_9MICO|nr:ABC transporter permease [Cryobacterium glaciale]TFB75871.1 ABC transporter permease [Cryobacterium glaciale]
MRTASALSPRGSETSTPRRNRIRQLPAAVSGQEVVLVGAIVALWVLLGLTTPAFLSAGSLQPLLSNIAPIAIIAIGQTIIMISGGIDVSVGSMVLVCAVVAAKLMVVFDTPLIVTIAAAMLVGGLLGLLNGVLIAVGRVHPIIITFATSNIFLFIGLRIFDSQTVTGIPPTLAVLGKGINGRFLGIPVSFLVMIFIAAAAWYYLRYVAGGRHFYAIGSDGPAARLTGIKVDRRAVLAYTVTGLLVGLASCMILANGTQNLDQTVGTGLSLATIAAVVIGGTSVLGGRGGVLGTILGAILVQTVASGVTQLGLPSQLGDLFVGLFIMVAVGTDLLRARARRRA